VAKQKRPTLGRSLASVPHPLCPGTTVKLFKGNRTAFPHKGYLFSVVCTAHGTITGTIARIHAQWRLNHPESFCPACRALADAATNA